MGRFMVSTRPEHSSIPAGSTDPRRALVSRVLTSATFAKSERLSSFLSCVCELTLNGRAEEINEQKIGTKFGAIELLDGASDKPSNYAVNLQKLSNQARYLLPSPLDFATKPVAVAISPLTPSLKISTTKTLDKLPRRKQAWPSSPAALR